MDIAGFIPGIGAFSEGANSLLYAFQGEKGDAALAALSAIESTDGIRYVREINLDKTIGIDKFSGQPTSIMTVLTDKFGNLVTATPGVIK